MSDRKYTEEDKNFLYEQCRTMENELEKTYNELIEHIGKLEPEERDKMLQLLFCGLSKEKTKGDT